VVIEATDQVAQTPRSGQSSEPSFRHVVTESPAGQPQPVSAADSKPAHPNKAKKPPKKPKPPAPPQVDPQGFLAAPSEADDGAQNDSGTAGAQLAPDTSADPGIDAGVQTDAPSGDHVKSAGKGKDGSRGGHKSKGGGKK
jgi:hypothetical protein